MLNRENGSVAITALVAIGALFFSANYVHNVNTRLAMTAKKAASDQESSEAQVKNLSNLATVKGLLSPALVSPGNYEPAIFPTNYFADSWQLKNNEILMHSGATEQPGEITVNTINKFGLNPQEVSDFFSATVPISFGSQSTLKIAKLIRDEFHYYYIRSIELKAEAVSLPSRAGSQSSTKATTARISLPVPEPGAAHIEITKASPIAWNTDFGSPLNPLPAGNYRLRIVASGIIYYAEISRNNGAKIVLGLENSEISHAANNIHATNVVIGETAEIPMGQNSTESVSSLIQSPLSISGVTTRNADCSFNIDRGGTIPPPAVGSTSVQTASVGTAIPMELAYKIFRVDGSESPRSGTQTIYFSSTLTTQTTSTIVASQNQTTFACREKCPTTRIQAQTNWMPFLDQSVLGSDDKTKLDVLRISESDAISQSGPGGSICGNLELAAQDLVHVLGYTLPTDLYITNSKWSIYHDRMDPGGASIQLERIFAYIAPSCERQLVGLRNGCGCFSADTRIKMGDGSEQLASTIRQGDFLWNPILRQAQRVKRVIAGPEALPLYRIEIGRDGNVVKVTSEHPFLTTTGPKTAKQLNLDDILINQERNDHITSISLESRGLADPDPIVWNFELEGSSADSDHYLIANDTMTGDLYMQQKLKQDRGVGKPSLSGQVSQ